MIRKHINLTPENLKELEDTGIFERKFGSTINEKIGELVDWNIQYPLAQVNSSSIEPLKNYSHSEEEFQALVEKFKRMRGHYDYIRQRKWQGALTPEQEKLCKEGNVRGVFGYPSKTESLSKKYRINPDKIDYILCKYHSMENYIAAYRVGNLDKQDFKMLGDNLADLQFDVNTALPDPFFIRLTQAIWGPQKNTASFAVLKFYDCNRILEALPSLTDAESDIICIRFDLHNSNNIPTLGETAKILKIPSKEKVRHTENAALRKLRHPSNLKYFLPVYDDSAIDEQSLSDEQQSVRASILDRIYNSNLIFVPDEAFSQEPADITPDELIDMAFELCAIQESILQRKFSEKLETEPTAAEPIVKSEIENSSLSVRAINALTKSGIITFEQLRAIPRSELRSLSGIGPLTYREIQNKLQTLASQATPTSLSDVPSQNVLGDSEPSRVENIKQPDNTSSVASPNHSSELERLKILKILKAVEVRKLEEMTKSAREKLASYDDRETYEGK